MVQLVALWHLRRAGFKPIALVGTATGQIGDPSGKSEDRALLQHDELASNAAGVRSCIEQVLAHIEARALAVHAEHAATYDDLAEGGPLLPPDMCPAPENASSGGASTAVEVAENAPFYEGMSALGLLRDVGQHFRLGTMLGRESVRARLQSPAGLSFTEFSYQLLQAWDFRELRRSRGCVLQMGGSDQWGNITAGVDLVRRVDAADVFGVTAPLLTTASGAKLGKTEGNAVWLTADRTSHFALYQYCMRMSDADAAPLLRRLSLLPLSACEEIERAHAARPESGALQRALATEVVTMSRGAAAAATAQAVTAALFGGKGGAAESPAADVAADISAAALAGEVPCAVVEPGALAGSQARDLAVAAGVAESKAQVTRLIKGGGVAAGARRLTPDRTTVEAADMMAPGLAVLRLGKSKPFVALERPSDRS
ncbi:hypothetical protein FNF31_07905 [Cafeteria roenbergensis]|uniref:Tyrosine--tRNA ligase n=1 Tax=Cafeteria roenbergensis TaxID=33653 RepID=A0A5A8BZN8_CAFRO|nr:hypothetical protein FNF31_07905 [Cafeteria roenbergensis]KAA0158771.1 hypothetical protein FNF28_06104 [Cafeteria roenbergensis]